MIVEATDSPVAKSRRRSVTRSLKPQVERSVKIGLYISPASARKLGATALMENRDRSEIIDELISRHLTRYVVQDRGRPTGEPVLSGEIGPDPAA